MRYALFSYHLFYNDERQSAIQQIAHMQTNDVRERGGGGERFNIVCMLFHKL